MLDPVPWFVEGGKHSPEVARMLAYAATNGANGIVGVTDLQVRALDVAGTSVRVMPGGAVLLNRYPGGQLQTYIARNETVTDVPVPATGSSAGATRYIIARIKDPQYPGEQVLEVPEDGPYIFLECVDSITSLAYPHVVLARINQPASTGTITQSMIVDLREVANPRENTVIVPRPNVTGDAGLVLTSEATNGEWFPNSGGEWYVDIPEWASYMQVRGEWLAVKYDAMSGHGEYWMEYGPQVATSDRERSTQRFKWDAAENANPYRTNWIAHDQVYIPWAYRGTTQAFIFKARHIGARTYYTGEPRMDPSSGTVLSVRFLERPDTEISS